MINTEVIDNYVLSLAKMIERMKTLNESISNLDSTQQDLLHYLEFNAFNASEGYKISKAIKDIREQRRLVKEEYDMLTKVVKPEKDKPQHQTIYDCINRANCAKAGYKKTDKGEEKAYWYNHIDVSEMLGRKKMKIQRGQ